MLVEPILRIVDSHRNSYKGSCLGSTSNMNHQRIIVWTYLQTLPPHKFNSLPLKSYLQCLPKRRVVLQPSFFRGYVKLQGYSSLSINNTLHPVEVQLEKPGFPHPVQGMASSFDTHGHFAVLLGLSFRRNSELTERHGGFWMGHLNFKGAKPWWFLREPGLVGGFFLVLWMIENAMGFLAFHRRQEVFNWLNYIWPMRASCFFPRKPGMNFLQDMVSKMFERKPGPQHCKKERPTSSQLSSCGHIISW